MIEFFFTAEDLRRLDEEIRKVESLLDQAAQETGASVGTGSETWHDNFGYEEGVRQQAMWSKRLSELRAVRSRATETKPPLMGDKVALGRTVIFKELITGKVTTVEIGSYMLFDGGVRRISYASPLAALMMGATAGQIREVKLGDVAQRLLILDVT